jgi:hypothetical protein
MFYKAFFSRNEFYIVIKTLKKKMKERAICKIIELIKYYMFKELVLHNDMKLVGATTFSISALSTMTLSITIRKS